MSIEFISAKDLPISEAEEVDVLCVENGELKRKEGTSLGGNKYDAKVKLWGEMVDGEMMLKGELLEGSFDALMEKINNDILTTALVIEDGTAWEQVSDGEFPYKGIIDAPLSWMKNTQSGVELVSGWGIHLNFAILSDNTVMIDG